MTNMSNRIYEYSKFADSIVALNSAAQEETRSRCFEPYRVCTLFIWNIVCKYLDVKLSSWPVHLVSGTSSPTSDLAKGALAKPATL